MKPSVGWVFILFFTDGTHFKSFHGGVGSVVRELLNYGKPWSAVGTVYKGVKVPPIFWVKKLSQALLTGGYIW